MDIEKNKTIVTHFVCTGDYEYRHANNKDCGNICCMDCKDHCACPCDVYIRETEYLGAKITKEHCPDLVKAFKIRDTTL